MKIVLSLLVGLVLPAWADLRVEESDASGVTLVLSVADPRDPVLTESREPGGPDLPRWNGLIAVPPGHGAVLEEVRGSRARRLRLPVEPVAQRRHCGEPHRFFRDEGLFRRESRAPLALLSPVTGAGPLRVALLTLHPLRPRREGGVTFVDEIRVRLAFVASRDAAPAPVGRRVGSETYRLFSRLTVNRSRELTRAAKDSDLIIADASYGSELSFLRWIQLKQEQGREVRVRYVTKPTTADVQGILREEFASDPPSHAVLVGSIDQIPSFRRGSYWSDYPYTLLDSGNYPDFSLGRLPARTGTELAAMLEKIMTRERQPRPDGRMLVTSGYETGWCHKNLAFIQANIFDKSPVPLSVTRLYASEGKKTDAVVDGYNADPNLIVYDGHGNQTSMTEIPLAISHFTRLKNRVFPILFDIACLNSYWPSSGASAQNFAHSLVTLADAGVAGLLAASSNSNGHDLFRYIFRAFIYDDKTPSDPHHRLNEVGSAVLYGKLKYLEESSGGGSALSDNQMFYYHGDPASTLFTPGT